MKKMTKKKKLSKEQIERAKDILAKAHVRLWIDRKKIVNEKGRRVRVGHDSKHFFLAQLYRDTSKEIAVQKPSQAGVSTWAILTEIHSAKYSGYNQIHTLPTADAVSKFVPSKTNEIIKRNPCIKAGMKNKETDAVGQKQFGKGFLYYKGTKSESDSLMLTSDRNWYDELDKSDMSQISIYDSRMEGAESRREKRYISTPTVPNYGINRVILESDQKHWRFTCGHCDHEQHMVWPDNVSLERKVYVCSHCQKDLDMRWVRPKSKRNPIGTGMWKAKYPKVKRSGYLLTQMIFPWISAESLVDYYNDAKNGKNDATMEYFYNHKLGLPYVSSDSRIAKDLILRNLTSRDHTELNSCMGVDVQERELYLHIGTEEGVFVIARVQDSDEYQESQGKRGKSKWDRWAELMEVYDVRYCVIDGGYKPHDSIAAANRFPGRVWVNWYKDDPTKAKVIRWADDEFQDNQKEFEEEIRVLTERDRIIDMLVEDLKGGRIRFFYGPYDEAIKMLIEHVETTYARTVTNSIGLPSREWVSTGKDDLLHALIYFKIALARKAMSEA